MSNQSQKLPIIKSPIFNKLICGDKFGTSPQSQEVSRLGMLYQSRLNVFDHTPASKRESETRGDDSIFVENKDQSTFREAESDELDDGDEMNLKLNPKQRLALTIRNWTLTEANDNHILNEGGIEALIALSLIEDAKLKRSCSGAFYHLSTRPKNRAKMLSLGATSGIVSIVSIGGIRHWDVAKFSAMALRNLSLEDSYESKMAKEGMSVCLVTLFGIRSGCLLQICMQALYNITCVAEEFPSMDRIAKIMLTVPINNSHFDVTLVVVKSMVNIMRFHKCRPRALDDGILNTFTAVLNGIGMRENPNREEMSFYIATALRSLSESRAIRLDMVSKGSVDIIHQVVMSCHVI